MAFTPNNVQGSGGIYTAVGDNTAGPFTPNQAQGSLGIYRVTLDELQMEVSNIEVEPSVVSIGVTLLAPSPFAQRIVEFNIASKFSLSTNYKGAGVYIASGGDPPNVVYVDGNYCKRVFSNFYTRI